MSVVDFPAGPDAGTPDRLPPQDIAAEASVLGAMMLSKDAIADVVETLREHDFYKPSHATIYGVIIDLYGRSEPVDALTVSAELQRRGESARVGGAPYLHTLVQGVPTAANASYYAQIVHERAILRRLVEGISGATQHIAGCKKSKTILAINTDPEAPIMAHADYAVIGDLHEVLPAIASAIRSR